MKKNNIFKIVLVFLIIIVCAVSSGLVYYFIKGGKNPIQDIINNFSNKTNFNDNYNGIYVYKDVYNGTKYVYNGCNLTSMDYYILVVNDDFYSFKSSCMGTYPLEEGKTKDLDIKENETKTNYYLTYKDKEYQKDSTINSIETNNQIAKKLKEIDLTNYELILKETEIENNYYRITASINNLSSKLVFGFDKLENGSFDLSIFNSGRADSLLLYKYNGWNYDNLPLFYPFGKTLAVIERGSSNGKLNYKFKAVNPSGIVYELDKKLPIVVDNVSLNNNNSIFVTYNEAKRNFTLLVGYNDKMCVEDSNSNNIAYYEFAINYDYLSSSFKTPEFVKYGRENEGCNYVNKIMGGAVNG